MAKIDFLKDPRVIGYGVIVVLLGVFVGLWYNFYYSPLLEQEKALNVQLEAKNREFEAIREMMRNLILLENEVAASENELRELQLMFPESKDVPGLIFEITRLSKQNNVLVTKFVPVGDNAHTYYVENVYSLSVVANYRRLGEFLASLANLKLIVNVDKLSMNPSEDVGNITGENMDDLEKIEETITSTFELTTYSSRKE